MDIFIQCNSFHPAHIGSTPTCLSNITHITSACVCSRWRHHVAWGPWIQNAPPTCLPLRLFLSLPLPSPVTATSCYVVTGEDFVCSLGGWKDSLLTTGMLGKWFNWVPWNGLLQVYCLLFLNFTFLTDPCFQGGGETCRNSSFQPLIAWQASVVCILPESSPQLTQH